MRAKTERDRTKLKNINLGSQIGWLLRDKSCQLPVMCHIKILIARNFVNFCRIQGKIEKKNIMEKATSKKDKDHKEDDLEEQRNKGHRGLNKKLKKRRKNEKETKKSKRQSKKDYADKRD